MAGLAPVPQAPIPAEVAAAFDEKLPRSWACRGAAPFSGVEFVVAAIFLWSVH